MCLSGMQTESAGCSVLERPPIENFGLQVSIIYEDASAGLRAKYCLDRLTRDLDMGAGFFQLRLWSFGLLVEASARSATARAAGNCDIVILSAHGRGDPSATVKEWMLEWLEHRSKRPCALAVLLDDETRRPSGENLLLDYLGGIARVGCLDLVYPFCESALQPTAGAIQKIARQAINAPRILESSLHPGKVPRVGASMNKRGAFQLPIQPPSPI